MPSLEESIAGTEVAEVPGGGDVLGWVGGRAQAQYIPAGRWSLELPLAALRLGPGCGENL